MTSIFSEVPPGVWSAIAGAVIALTGVLLSNASHNRRLRLQLANDSAEKSKERIATLRREVYLSAAEEMVKAGSYLAGLPQSDLTKANPGEGLQAFFGVAAKLQLVAEPKTALLVNELSSAYGELLMNVLPRLMPVQSARTDIQIQDDLYKESQAQAQRVLLEIGKFNESANTDEKVWAALQRAFDLHQQTAHEHGQLRSEASARFNDAQREFSRQLAADLRDLGDLPVRVIVEIRRDLGLTSDLDAFRTQMNAHRQKMEDQLNAFLEKLSLQS